MTNKINTIALVTLLALGACTPAPTPVSPLLKAQVVKFLEAGSKLTAATETGITLGELNRQVSEMNGIYKLMLDMDTNAIPGPIKNECFNAINDWQITAKFWAFKNKYPNVYAAKYISDTDVQVFKSNVELMGKYAVIESQGMDMDASISKGLSGASEHFENAKKGLILLAK